MTRRLTLRRETLAALGPAELRGVGGGQETLVCVPTRARCTGYYPSLNAPCESEIVCIADPTGYYPSINAPCSVDC